jgi:hypothetical protein
VRPRLCRIIIAGRLDEASCEAFADFRIEFDGTNTALIGKVDQAALHGVLNRIQSLGLEVIDVRRLPDDAS